MLAQRSTRTFVCVLCEMFALDAIMDGRLCQQLLDSIQLVPIVMMFVLFAFFYTLRHTEQSEDT